MKLTVALTLLLFCQIGFAQEMQGSLTHKTFSENKNLVKLNILALTLGNFSVQYEREIGSKFTVGASVNFMPERKLPFSSKLESFVDDETTAKQLKGIKLSSFSFTPEIRYYFGKEVFKGFYVAPFMRLGSYSIKFPVNYTYDNYNLSLNINGDISAVSGGLAVGAQWKLSKNIYLDWLIVGPHFGNSKGTLSGFKNLSEGEQEAIKDALKDLDIPIVDFDYQVNGVGAKVKVKGPWAGFRASLGVGYRF